MRILPVGTLESISQAASILKSGGIILYPTDTLYGLGADALSDEAVDKVYAIKGRDEKKPMHCIVADMKVAQQYAEVTDFARRLANAFLPGPLTLILKKKPDVQKGIARDIDTIGIRIPNNEFCLALARAFGGPYTTTSANRSGEEPKRDVEAILKQLGEGGAGIELVLDEGPQEARKPSTVVDLSHSEPVILREGAIEAAEIWDVLRTER